MLIMSRVWAMPNALTFQIRPVRDLLARYIRRDDAVVDPFALNAKWGTVTNDLNPSASAEYHLDAEEFLKLQPSDIFDAALLDPPYSQRQVVEHYQRFGRKVTRRDTQMAMIRSIKNEVHRILKPSGLVISFGWNSTGMGRNQGYEPLEILLINHGGTKHDTIVVVERKMP